MHSTYNLKLDQTILDKLDGLTRTEINQEVFAKL